MVHSATIGPRINVTDQILVPMAQIWITSKMMYQAIKQLWRKKPLGSKMFFNSVYQRISIFSSIPLLNSHYYPYFCILSTSFRLLEWPTKQEHIFCTFNKQIYIEYNTVMSHVKWYMRPLSITIINEVKFPSTCYIQEDT